MMSIILRRPVTIGPVTILATTTAVHDPPETETVPLTALLIGARSTATMIVVEPLPSPEPMYLPFNPTVTTSANP